MTLTDRDRKILIAVVPVVILVAYWFLLFAPKREEASAATDALAVQQARVENARAAVESAEGAKQSFDDSYSQIVRLGKAIPSTVDMPSLLVQLDAAAAGTGIRFTKIATGDRVQSAVPATTTTTSSAAGSESGTTDTAAAAGGETAQSESGSAAETANETQQTANETSAAAENSDADTGTTTGTGDASGTAPAGLETVPLELAFEGNFFNLADFFHSIKRFVSLTNNDVLVSGRLLTVESVRWSSDEAIFPHIRAELTATIYLSPKAQGVTAGATSEGPATGTTTDGTTTSSESTAAATPTATATR